MYSIDKQTGMLRQGIAGGSGIPGPPGPQGTLTEFYEYDIASSYDRLALVAYNGGGWQVTAAQGVNPGQSPDTAASKYICVAVPGSSGASGGTAAATVTQVASGAIIVTSDTISGQTSAFVSNGPEGSQGIPGAAALASVTQVSSGAIVVTSDTVSGQTSAFIANGSQGIPGSDGRLISASVVVSSLTSGALQVTNEAVPVTVKTDLGHMYPIQKGSLIAGSGYWDIDPAPYMAYDNVSSFTAPWTVYFAGGVPDNMTIINAGTAITPIEHQVFQHTLAQSDSITIDTSYFTSDVCTTFELWLDMPSTVVTFTIPAYVTWLDGAPPDFSFEDTRYAIVFRWNGEKLIADLSYTEFLT